MISAASSSSETEALTLKSVPLPSELQSPWGSYHGFLISGSVFAADFPKGKPLWIKRTFQSSSTLERSVQLVTTKKVMGVSMGGKGSFQQWRTEKKQNLRSIKTKTEVNNIKTNSLSLLICIQLFSHS